MILSLYLQVTSFPKTDVLLLSYVDAIPPPVGGIKEESFFLLWSFVQQLPFFSKAFFLFLVVRSIHLL